LLRAQVAKGMMSEVFSGALPAVVTASFTSSYLMMLAGANLSGRFGMATLSDRIGCRNTFNVIIATLIPIYFTAPLLVNAAGAWADDIARMAGVQPVGVEPCRRTVISFAAPDGEDAHGWPFTKTVGEGFYLLPEGRGQLLASSMDQTPSAPCDAAPEELDIAIAADRVEQATTLPICRISHSWAGLRSFAPDELPVIGHAAGAAGFVWCAGQGGAGFQTAPALSRVAESAVLGLPFPDDCAAAGLSAALFSPARFGA